MALLFRKRLGQVISVAIVVVSLLLGIAALCMMVRQEFQAPKPVRTPGIGCLGLPPHGGLPQWYDNRNRSL